MNPFRIIRRVFAGVVRSELEIKEWVVSGVSQADGQTQHHKEYDHELSKKETFHFLYLFHKFPTIPDRRFSP